MNFRKLQLIVLASALGGAVGIASAQQVTTPAAAKTATDIQGNAALTSETALAGTPRQGSPGTQSGVAVTDTTSLGASSASFVSGPIYSFSNESFPNLSRTQLLELQRYNALR